MWGRLPSAVQRVQFATSGAEASLMPQKEPRIKLEEDLRR